ncbi:MAG: DUF4252 domain-containing protein [Alloprevotella sp.]|nr:DUF4252 domain-containing protein [Alloprevotella sp.]
MKKIFILTAMWLVCMSGFSQTVNDLFSQYKDKEGVELIQMPKEVLRLASGNIDDENVEAVLENIDLITVLQIENKSLVADFSEKTAGLEQQGYNKIVTSQEENERVLILSRSEGDDIVELLVLSIEPDEVTLVQVLGKIKVEDVEKIVSM